MARHSTNRRCRGQRTTRGPRITISSTMIVPKTTDPLAEGALQEVRIAAVGETAKALGSPLACHFANHDTEAHRPVERKLRKAAVYWGSRGDTQGTADTNLLILA